MAPVSRVKALDEAFKVTRKKGMHIEPGGAARMAKAARGAGSDASAQKHNVPLGDGLFEQVGEKFGIKQGGRVGDLLRPREPLAHAAANYRKFVAIPTAGFTNDRGQ